MTTWALFLSTTGCDDGAADPGAQCTSRADCLTPLVCDVPSGECVECTQSESAACSGAEPVCGIDHTCRGCSEHSECASTVCLPDGSCADPSTVAFVAENGSGTACTEVAPCRTLADGVARGHDYIKVKVGLVKDNKETTIDGGRTVTILADPEATLDRDGDGPVLVVRGANTNVRIFDLKITGATGSSGDGVQLEPNGGEPKLSLLQVQVRDNQGIGISIDGGQLTVSQSTISSNQGGGISVTGAATIFNITNTFIVRNGNSSATVGGASLDGATTGNVFEFNTLADNGIRVGALAGGVSCNISGFTAPNNLIVRNLVNNMPGMPNSNTGGVCTFPTSTIATTISGLDFVKADEPPFNYHIQQASSAIDQATTASTVNVDVDGNARPQGSASDQGADEFKP